MADFILTSLEKVPQAISSKPCAGRSYKRRRLMTGESIQLDRRDWPSLCGLVRTKPHRQRGRCQHNRSVAGESRIVLRVSYLAKVPELLATGSDLSYRYGEFLTT